jgi:multidrug efflux system outer membrane protein
VKQILWRCSRRAFAGTRGWPGLLPLTLLAGCVVGPKFNVPGLNVPTKFSATAENNPPSWPRQGWWRNFGSPALDALIGQAKTNNFSVRIAVAQLEAANAQIEISGAPLLPALTATGGGNVQQAQAGRGTAAAFAGGGKTIDARSFTTSFQASYELDFWGRNYDALRAAQANAAAAQFNAATVALTEEASVATTYFQTLAYQDELAIARRNLAAATSLLRQLQAEFRAGVTDSAIVAQQAALVAAERATIPNLQSELRQQAIGLGILTGAAPEFLHVPGSSLAALHVPSISPGLPSQLLTRRPDIAQSEAVLIAANANVRGAIAAFFPSISLTGSAGWQSTALNTLFNPGSFLLNAASSLTQPIFEGGALSGELGVSRATYHEDVARYEQSVVQAFTDVETALTALRFATEQEALQNIAVTRARDALAGAQAQLNAGIVDISTVLNAQETLLSDENTLEQTRLTRFNAAVNLYRALGGGWSLQDAERTGTSSR